jgi:16S rRNA (cytidine1402-2'-O)-methyltransferase
VTADGTTGAIVLVATPIGNLGDLSRRAVATLEAADVICCEDTRRTRALLAAAGVPAAGRLVSLHAHNEASRIPELLETVTRGATVAVVSDAGTPAVSDPGNRLVAAAAAAGLTVTLVPGPSAVLAALVVSGLPTDRFCVEGFLPRKGADRRRRLEAVAGEERTVVVLEAPGRLGATLGDLAAQDPAAPDRRVAVCRELTKLHEEVWRGTLAEAAAEFAAREVKGEVVLVVAGRERAPAAPVSDEALEGALAERLAAGDSTKEAATAVAALLGVGRRRAYEAAISGGRGDAPGAQRRRRPPR